MLRRATRASSGRAARWLLPAVVLAGCASSWLPGRAPTWEVAAVSQRGPYLDAVIQNPKETLRFYFPNDETCRETLALESEVAYRPVGRLGTVRRAGKRCEAIGVASLRAWMSRRPRPEVKQKPRAQASFRLSYDDPEVLLARGNFPLARLINWVGASDTLAVMPRTEACLAAVERGVASMEFSTLAGDPFWLVVANDRCPIDGFVQPLVAASGQ